MARPTKWTPEKVNELADKMNVYFEKEYTLFQNDKTYKSIPFIGKFCREIGKLSVETLNVKSKENKLLAETLKKIKEIQKEILILGGLDGRFNQTAFIFTAKNITDMRDQTNLDLTSKGKELKKITKKDVIKKLTNLKKKSDESKKQREKAFK